MVYSVVSGMPNDKGIVDYYKIIVTFKSFAKAMELLNDCKTRLHVTEISDGVLRHNDTGEHIFIYSHLDIYNRMIEHRRIGIFVGAPFLVNQAEISLKQ